MVGETPQHPIPTLERIAEIEAKVRAGGRLSAADGLDLYHCDRLALLGRLAHQRRTGVSGDRTTFVMNRNLTLTNICSASCTYCSFHRKPGEKGAYILQVEEAVTAAVALRDAAGTEDLTELQIVNGLHPAMPWRYYPQVLRELKAALPGIRLRAFSATEIHWYEKMAGKPAEAILDELIEAGLESLAGAGAEIFDPDVRRQLVDHGTHWEDWSRIHQLAHRRGINTPATMLYGHIEEPRHRVDHLLRLRDLQDETGGFQVFVPIRYEHDVVGAGDGAPRNRLQGRTTMAAPAESLRVFALARLLLDNIAHVNAAWGTHGTSVAGLALGFGADDLDASVEYKHAHAEAAADGSADGDAAPPAAPQPLSREDILRLITEADCRPVERDTRFDTVRGYDGPLPLAVRRAQPQRVWD